MGRVGAGNDGGMGGVVGGRSENVRNELRAHLGARLRPDMHAQMQPDLEPLISFAPGKPHSFTPDPTCPMLPLYSYCILSRDFNLNLCNDVWSIEQC